ncbi:MAG: transporter substrate-binding protein [Rhodospirillales bacterium]|nr:transporter substrate-binding protein [Rhodospirillales bacterium]
MAKVFSRRAMLRATVGVAATTALSAGLPSLRRARTGSPVEIGIVTHGLGPFAARGRQEQRGALLAIEEANETGGILGGVVRCFRVDAHAFLQGAALLGKRGFGEHGSLFLIGGSEAATVRAISDVAELHNVIYLATAPCGSTPIRTSNGTTFAWAGTADSLARAALIQGVRAIGGRCVIVYSDAPVARAAAALARRTLVTLGNAGAEEMRVAVGTRDFGPMLSWVANVAVDVAIVAICGLDLTVMRQQVQDLGLDRTQAWLFLSQSGCDRGPPGADNGFGIYATNWHPDLPLAGVAAFVGRFRRRWPECSGPDDIAYNAYTAARELLQTIVIAGTTSGDTLIPLLESHSAAGDLRMQHHAASIDRSTGAMRQTTYIISGGEHAREAMIAVAPDVDEGNIG